MAALLLVLFLVVDVAVGLVTWKWRQEASAHAYAEIQRNQAEENARSAEEARDRAEAGAYLNGVAAAEREFSPAAPIVPCASSKRVGPTCGTGNGTTAPVIKSQVYSRPRRGGSSDDDVPPDGWNDFARLRTPLPHPAVLRLNPSLSPDCALWPGPGPTAPSCCSTPRRGTRSPTQGRPGQCRGHGFQPRRQTRRRRLLGPRREGVQRGHRRADLHRLRSHRSRDGRRLQPRRRGVFSASRDATVKVWDATTGKLLQTSAPTNGATELAVSRDGTLLAAGGYRSSGNVWNLRTGKLVLELSHHKEPVRAVAFSDDGTLLATAGDDRTVKLFSLQPGKKFGLELTAFRGHTGSVSHLAFDPDGKFLASCSGDPTNGEIRVWDLRGWREIRYLAHYPSEIVQTTFTKGKHTALTLTTGPAAATSTPWTPSSTSSLPISARSGRDPEHGRRHGEAATLPGHSAGRTFPRTRSS